jgi:hypothetical protein
MPKNKNIYFEMHSTRNKDALFQAPDRRAPKAALRDLFMGFSSS